MRCLLIILALGLSSPVEARSPIAEIICAPSDQMRERLKDRMDSSLTASGLRSPEEMIEVWTDASGAWTMVIRYSSGNSCIVAMGEAWQAKAPQTAAKPLKRM